MDPEKYDIIYIYDSELNFNSGKTNARPCILMSNDYEEKGYGYVIPLSSQRSFLNKHKLDCGSYIDLKSPMHKISSQIIKYSEVDFNKIILSKDDIDFLKNNF